MFRNMGLGLIAIGFIGIFFTLHSADAENGESLTVAVSQNFLRSMMSLQLQDQTPVSDYVMGSVVTGTAFTSGTLFPQIVACNDGAIVDFVFDSTTRSSTVAFNQPKRNLSVNVWANGVTTMRSIKRVGLHPHGIGTLPAFSYGNTHLGLTGTAADGRGLMGLFEGVANRKAAKLFEATRAQNEATTNQKAIDQLNAKIDQMTGPLFGSLNRDYYNILYEPVFEKGNMAGTLRTRSSWSNVYLEQFPRTPLGADAVRATPPMRDDVGIALRMHETVVNQQLDAMIEDHEYDEEMLEEFLVVNGIPSKLGDFTDGKPQVHVKFCAGSRLPVRVSFGENVANLYFCFETVKFDRAEAANVEVAAAYALAPDAAGNIRLTRSKEVAVRGAAGNAVDDIILQSTRKSFVRLLPEGFTLGRMDIPDATGNGRTLGVIQTLATSGWFTATWALK